MTIRRNNASLLFHLFAYLLELYTAEGVLHFGTSIGRSNALALASPILEPITQAVCCVERAGDYPRHFRFRMLPRYCKQHEL